MTVAVPAFLPAVSLKVPSLFTSVTFTTFSLLEVTFVTESPTANPLARNAVVDWLVFIFSEEAVREIVGVSLATVLCDFSIVPHTLQWLPSVFPSVRTVAATAASVTALWPATGIVSVLVALQVLQVLSLIHILSSSHPH